MIILLSPAKALDFRKKLQTDIFTQPSFQNESERLINRLKKISRKKLTAMMGISDKLADLNYNRYQEWSLPFNADNSKQAICVFNGEVYNGLKASELNEQQLLFAQEHVRILSGLHGLLNPLDLIQPYRLEMGTALKIGRKNNLYDFWGDTLRLKLEEDLSQHSTKFLINLASNEYSKSARLIEINYPVINIAFKELRGDEYKMVLVYTKKARGLMTRFIIDNRIDEPEKLKLFDYEGYFYNDNLSGDNSWVFTR